MLEEELICIIRNGLSMRGRGKVKLPEEAIVRKGGWAGACGLHRHLSLKGEVIKARECEEERRESGGHMSL